MEIKHKIQFGGNIGELAEKVLSGEKIATSSLHDYYLENLKEMSKVGEYAAILDSLGNEICIIRIEKIQIIRFQDITETFAVEEGDGDLHNWLKIHTEYYSAQLEKIGKKTNRKHRISMRMVQSDKIQQIIPCLLTREL